MKTCLVTGASGGIGGAIAKSLALQGYKVLLQGRNKDKLKKLQDSIEGESELVIGDLNLKDERKKIFEQLFKFTNIDLLVNAAGVSEFSAFEEKSESDIARLITTNLITPIQFIQEFMQANQSRVKAEKVTIVNVGSAFGYIGYPGFSTYSASKFGLRGFTESLHREYADTQYRFAYFAPRATHTEINSSQVDDMNKALGNSIDSTDFVAKEFMLFLKTQNRESTVGWPEKLFVKVNGLLPKVVDNAIKSKLPVIRQYMGA